MGQICSLFKTVTNQLSSNEDEVHTNDADDIESTTSNPQLLYNIFNPLNSKKALLIGVNYDSNYTRQDDLFGCENDTRRLKQFLIDNLHFAEEDIEILLTEESTKSNIENKLLEMVEFANNNNSSEVFISFSGHGSYMKNDDEVDGQSESICPVDYLRFGQIHDYWIKEYIIDKLPCDSKMFLLIDACHSGTVCNLSFQYDIKTMSTTKIEDNSACSANVVKISGCQDKQVSYDYYNVSEKEYNGALTNSFIETFEEQLDFKEHLLNIHEYLKNRFSQIPNLTYSKKDLLISKL